MKVPTDLRYLAIYTNRKPDHKQTLAEKLYIYRAMQCGAPVRALHLHLASTALVHLQEAPQRPRTHHQQARPAKTDSVQESIMSHSTSAVPS